MKPSPTPERIASRSDRFEGGNRERKSTFSSRGTSMLSSAANAWLAATSRLVGVWTIAQGTPARRRWTSNSGRLLWPSPSSAGCSIREIIGDHLCALGSRALNAGAERAAGTQGEQGSKGHHIRSPSEGPRRACRDHRPRRWLDYAVSA